MTGDDHLRPRDGLPDLVGSTPLVRLRRLHPGGPRVYAKLESFNPGGSAKDRPAAAMIKAAMDAGLLRVGDTVVESSSGNLGVALAQVCRWYGLQFVCVVDPRTPRQTARIIEVYGGRLHRVTAPDSLTGDWLVARRNAVAELLGTIPRSWTPDQYANRLNPSSHMQTMREILKALGRAPAVLFVAASTTGTLQGCQQYLQSVGAATRVVAVDAVGSVLFGGDPGPRLMPGFGAGVVPPLAAAAAPHAVVRVDDLDCVLGCRRLAWAESLLVGASGGGVVTALGRQLEHFGPEDQVVLVLHDGGERYLDSVYDDGWVAANLGCDAQFLAGGLGSAAPVA